ncbi:hypothetical protein MRB53_037770 [Persea americana]|nr:hypothetical protein MRB53_037770 [Persea americana]
MRWTTAILYLLPLGTQTARSTQHPLQPGQRFWTQENATISKELFNDLERLSRLADIAYCVSPPSTGLSKPFTCLSHCAEFPKFELVIAWNTGPLLSDTAGYVALDHGNDTSEGGQVVIAFRGTYSLTNAVIDLSTIPQEYTPYPGDDGDEDTMQSRCINCTVHNGFNTAWRHTKAKIMDDVLYALRSHSNYNLTLIGHSLGGAVAMLAALEFKSRGFNPKVTTFGEPRVGNQGLADHVDSQFNLTNSTDLLYRRVTHVDDPVPLLPLTEWNYAMHAGEIFISKPALSPNTTDLRYCAGDADPDCIAAQDGSIHPEIAEHKRLDVRNVLTSEIPDVLNEPWGIPSRYRLWQLLFAHRDYFHRIGLCIPGGDPLGGGRDYMYDQIDL